MRNELKDKSVLVTGGTAGIGLATALAFACQQADVVVTYRWGSADPDDIAAAFAAAGARPPTILEADVTSPEATAEVFDVIGRTHTELFALVSNVGFAQLVHGIDDYELKGLLQSIEYSAWPLASHLQAARRRFSRWPRYAVAVSSCGVDEYHSNYDFAASAKAVLETLVRYLAHRLRDEGCLVNGVRPRWVETESLTATVGPEFVETARRFHTPGLLQRTDEVANVILALCSGYLDGMRGQVLTVDHGTRFYDNIMRHHATHSSDRGSDRAQDR
ncbi:SDR family oxidoreductase [Krasilnikovia sp. MM14-A1259]|uniref:SDR family oxidoreductase n=1 Tax=Krasilnikovia sp. MM14-A1259 TaxID=3373539 RepID=UPI0038275120